MRPHLGQVEGVPAGALLPVGQLLARCHLYLDVPLREVASSDRLEQVAPGMVRIRAGNPYRLGGAEVLDPLAGLEVPFHVHALPKFVDQAIRVAAEAVHVAVAVRGAAA